MKLKSKLVAAMVLAASASMAQASTYTVDAIFFEDATNGVNTEFHGTFDWNGSTVSNFMGTMNESMRGFWTDAAGHDYTNYGGFTTWSGTTIATGNGQKNNLVANGTFMLTLDQNLIQSDTGSLVTASIFKENTSNVFAGGGYATPNDPTGAAYNKYIDPSTSKGNENAFFTLVFEHDALGNITSLGFKDTTGNPTLVNQMIYGDCTVGSLMMAGSGCMAGEPSGTSMMAGIPLSLEINQVAAVPLPGAVWLFGGALLSLVGANRRKNVLPA
jgi:hypothetical protein